MALRIYKSVGDGLIVDGGLIVSNYGVVVRLIKIYQNYLRLADGSFRSEQASDKPQRVIIYVNQRESSNI